MDPVPVTPLDPSVAVPSAPARSPGTATMDGLLVDTSGVVSFADQNAVDHCQDPVEDLLHMQETGFVVLLDPSVPAPLDEVAAHAEVTRTYLHLPLLEIHGSAEQARAVAGLPGVHQVWPQLVNNAASRRVAIGLDVLSRIADRQNTQRAGDPPLIGGSAPFAPPGYPVITGEPGKWVLDFDSNLDWPTAPAALPIINLSVGPASIRMPETGNDLALLALRLTGSHLLAVVAAGNCGRCGHGSMSAWARNEVVLSVGATTSADGNVLADYSSRGIPEDPASGPDLAAYGASALDPNKVGTSFAAPRVSGCARLVVAAFLQVRRLVLLARGAPPHGVPLVGLGIIDAYGSKIWGPPRSLPPIPGLPITGASETAVQAVLNALASVGAQIQVLPTQRFLRSFLLGCARTMPQYGPHEVGAGFLDEDLTIAGLSAVTGAQLADWFADRPLPEDVRAALSTHRIFEPTALDALRAVVSMAGPVFAYDRHTQRVGIQSMFSSEMAHLDLDTRVSGLRIR